MPSYTATQCSVCGEAVRFQDRCGRDLPETITCATCKLAAREVKRLAREKAKRLAREKAKADREAKRLAREKAKRLAREKDKADREIENKAREAARTVPCQMTGCNKRIPMQREPRGHGAAYRLRNCCGECSQLLVGRARCVKCKTSVPTPSEYVLSTGRSRRGDPAATCQCNTCFGWATCRAEGCKQRKRVLRSPTDDPALKFVVPLVYECDGCFVDATCVSCKNERRVSRRCLLKRRFDSSGEPAAFYLCSTCVGK
jgi:hypothetical protein